MTKKSIDLEVILFFYGRRGVRKRYCPSDLPLHSIPPRRCACGFLIFMVDVVVASRVVLRTFRFASSPHAWRRGAPRLRPRVARVLRTTLLATLARPHAGLGFFAYICSMLDQIKVVAFDADDTLWENEKRFRKAEKLVAERLSEYGDFDYISSELYKTECANMEDYGFGAKAYILSMVETAVNISKGKVDAGTVKFIIDSGREILHNPAKPFPGVVETLRKLSDSGAYSLVLLTKGELLDQEHKIARSGLAGFFSHIEILSNKSGREYSSLCAKLGIEPGQFMMVGNSFKSDIDPVLRLGGWGVHIPFEVLWKLEHVDEYDHPRLFRLSSIDQLPGVLL